MIFNNKKEGNNESNADADNSMELIENDRMEPITKKEIYKNIKSKKLICHFMVDRTNEVGVKRAKIYDQEIMWHKRMWPIDSTAFITDSKGVAHYFVDVNESTGILRFNKSYIDRCVECGNKIGQDAVNTRDLLKRKTISSIWGIDSSHVMLLLILGIALLIMGVAVMYMYGENQKMSAKLQQYLPPPPAPVKHTAYDNTLTKELTVNV